MVKLFLYRSIWLPVAITTTILFIALFLLMGAAWRSLDRLQLVHKNFEHIIQTQELSLRIQHLLTDHLNTGEDISPAVLSGINTDLNNIVQTAPDKPEISNSLQRTQEVLNNQQTGSRLMLTAGLEELRHVLNLETHAHDKMVREASNAAGVEMKITTATIIVLPALGLLMLFLVRHRIMQPLSHLGLLMSQLAQREYSLIDPVDTDPMLKPLLDNYNFMVQRLSDLERTHQMTHASLESQVRSAASALLDQQRTLANAERMAVVGELAARLAHELRNPLAGMQMALTNLQREISEHDKAQRLGLVVDELNRVTALLNSLLDQSRHHPEPVKLMRLAPVIEELLTLARYQTPETIQIEQDIAEEIECRLPENGLRRTLLNLILNACQAIGDQPGHIRVSARIEKDSLIIDVTDDGPGFPPTLLQSGIRPFISTRSDGTGLGLASVQRFATDLQGRLELRNVEPHGARVTLILPAAGENHG